MDTYKDKQTLDDMVARGDTPWELWRQDGTGVQQVPGHHPESSRTAFRLAR
jgi:hypothetical protein